MNTHTRAHNIMNSNDESSSTDVKPETMTYMQAKGNNRRKVVGYIRVSTPEQEKNGISLDSQPGQLRDYASGHNLDLTGIFEDGQSAHGRRSSNRPGLLQAIAQARSEGIPLLVTSIDRLSRSECDFKLLDVPGLSVLSVKEGRVGKKRLRVLVQAAEAQSAEASLRSQAAVAKSKAAGRKPGNKTNLKDAQRSGALSNMMRSTQKIKDLSDYIARHPGIRGLPWSDRAAMLNSDRHYNLISATHDVTQTWTKDSLRKPFKAALTELALQEELDREDAALAKTDATDIDDVAVTLPCEPVAQQASQAAAGGHLILPTSAHGPEAATLSTGHPMNSAESSGSPIPGAVANLGIPSLGSAPVTPEKDDRPTPLQRRALNKVEIALLKRIMRVRGMNESQVMDELGLPRLNASLWHSRRQGSTVSPDMLNRLLKWFGDNCAIWLKR